MQRGASPLPIFMSDSLLSVLLDWLRESHLHHWFEVQFIASSCVSTWMLFVAFEFMRLLVALQFAFHVYNRARATFNRSPPFLSYFFGWIALTHCGTPFSCGRCKINMFGGSRLKFISIIRYCGPGAAASYKSVDRPIALAGWPAEVVCVCGFFRSHFRMARPCVYLWCDNDFGTEFAASFSRKCSDGLAAITRTDSHHANLVRDEYFFFVRLLCRLHEHTIIHYYFIILIDANLAQKHVRSVRIH